jgi:hypothetical protein
MQASGDAASADSFGKWENRMRLVQKATGASQSDLESAMSLISNKGDQWFKAGVSQQDLVSLYTALKGSNAFDSDEEIERAMRSFMASGVTAENFYDKMAAYDWSRHVWNSANKNQADNFRRNFDFAALRQANTQAVSSDVQQSAAEKAAETARRVAAKKDELVMRILKKIEPLMDSGTLDKIIDNLFKMLEVALPLLEPVLKVVDKVFKALEPVINKMVQLINRLVYAMENADGIKSFFELLANEQPSDGNATGAPQSGGQKAVGGIAIAPTIVGERGAEAIIPLDYARAGRAAQVMQNITQTFNMGGSQTTAMSLGQAVKQRSFTDNLLSNRLYGGR